MSLIVSSLTAPALVTNVGEEIAKVGALFARGPEEPLSYKRFYKADLSAARKAAISATPAEKPVPSPAAPTQGGPSL